MLDEDIRRRGDGQGDIRRRGGGQGDKETGWWTGR